MPLILIRYQQVRSTAPTQSVMTSPPQHRMVSALQSTYKPGTPSHRVAASLYERPQPTVKQKCSSHPGTPNLADHHKNQQKVQQYPKQQRHGSPLRPPPPYAGGQPPMHSTAKVNAPPQTLDTRKHVTSQNSYNVTSQKHKTALPQVSQPSSKHPLSYPPTQLFPGYHHAALPKSYLAVNSQTPKTGNEVCF